MMVMLKNRPIWFAEINDLLLHAIRPAPAELPQGRKAARVRGCSGAI
jgi:hypothetical protein